LLSSLKTPMEHSLPCVWQVKNTEVLEMEFWKWNCGNGNADFLFDRLFPVPIWNGQLLKLIVI